MNTQNRSIFSTSLQRGVFHVAIVGLVLSSFFLVGCGELKEYRDPNLKMTVERLDPALKDRWGSSGVVVKESPPGTDLAEGDLVTHLVTRVEVSSGEELQAALKKAMAPRRHFWQFRTPETSDATALFEIERDGKILYIELATREPGEWKKHGLAFTGTEIRGLREGYAPDNPSPSPAQSSGFQIGDKVLAIIDEDAVPSVEAFKQSAALAVDADNVYVYTHELTGIKLEAIAALGELGGDDPRVLNRLLDIMENSTDPAMRRTAVSALGSLAEYQAGETLLQAMLAHLRLEDEPDAEIRRGVTSILELLVDKLGGDAFDDEAVQIIADAMEDPDPGVHFKAGVILHAIGERAIPTLTAALESPDTPTRVKDIAATALGAIGGTRARDTLITALRNTDDVTLQLTIATALADIGDSSSLRELRAFLSRTEHSGVREFVRQLLEQTANVPPSGGESERL